MMRALLLVFCMMFGSAFADLTTMRLGNQTYTSGYVNGEYVNTTSMTLGNQTYTSGRVGDASVNTTSMSLGNQTYTNGRVGDENLNTTSMKLGNQTYTNGRIGDRSINATTMQLGNQTFTSGTIGESSVRTTTQRLGGQEFTSGTVRSDSYGVLGGVSYTGNKGLGNKATGVETVEDIERDTQSIKDEIARLKRELEIEKENARVEAVRQEKMRKSDAAKKREQALMQKEQEEVAARSEDIEDDEERTARLSDRKPSSRLVCSSVVSSAHVRTLTLENGKSFRVGLRDQFFISGWVGDTIDVYCNFDKRGRYTGTVLKNATKNKSMKVD